MKSTTCIESLDSAFAIDPISLCQREGEQTPALFGGVLSASSYFDRLGLALLGPSAKFVKLSARMLDIT